MSGQAWCKVHPMSLFSSPVVWCGHRMEHRKGWHRDGPQMDFETYVKRSIKSCDCVPCHQKMCMRGSTRNEAVSRHAQVRWNLRGASVHQFVRKVGRVGTVVLWGYRVWPHVALPMRSAWCDVRLRVTGLCGDFLKLCVQVGGLHVHVDFSVEASATV